MNLLLHTSVCKTILVIKVILFNSIWFFIGCSVSKNPLRKEVKLLQKGIIKDDTSYVYALPTPGPALPAEPHPAPTTDAQRTGGEQSAAQRGGHLATEDARGPLVIPEHLSSTADKFWQQVSSPPAVVGVLGLWHLSPLQAYCLGSILQFVSVYFHSPS